eukprot:scaffold16872_cov121-Isochrysis_galbana.AAC.2
MCADDSGQWYVYVRAHFQETSNKGHRPPVQSEWGMRSRRLWLVLLLVDQPGTGRGMGRSRASAGWPIGPTWSGTAEGGSAAPPGKQRPRFGGLASPAALGLNRARVSAPTARHTAHAKHWMQVRRGPLGTRRWRKPRTAYNPTTSSRSGAAEVCGRRVAAQPPPAHPQKRWRKIPPPVVGCWLGGIGPRRLGVFVLFRPLVRCDLAGAKATGTRRRRKRLECWQDANSRHLSRANPYATGHCTRRARGLNLRSPQRLPARRTPHPVRRRRLPPARAGWGSGRVSDLGREAPGAGAPAQGVGESFGFPRHRRGPGQRRRGVVPHCSRQP